MLRCHQSAKYFFPVWGASFRSKRSDGERLVIVIHDDGTRELYHFTRTNWIVQPRS